MSTKGKLLTKMLALAVEKFDERVDRGGNPYILHPLTVMLWMETHDEELQCIALGHDLIEDNDVTAASLVSQGFTIRIVRGIIDLTRIDGEPEALYRKRVMSNIDAVKVKKRDLRHNMDLGRLKKVTEKDEARNSVYAEFYASLSTITSE